MTQDKTGGPARETPDQLRTRMEYAEHQVPAGQFIRHVATGNEYIVRGHCLRVGDLAPMALYSPRNGPVIVFSREVKSVLAKFVLSDGEQWPIPARNEGQDT